MNWITHKMNWSNAISRARNTAQVLDVGSSRVMQPHAPIHELHAVGFNRCQDPVKLRRVKSRGLLHQHVFLSTGSHNRPPHVQTRGERHVHGVHAWVLQHLIVASVNPHAFWKPVLGGKPLCLLLGTARDGAESGVGGKGNGSSHFPSNVGAA